MEEESSQAEFVGRLALVLAALAVCAALIIVVRAGTFPSTGGASHVDQAGSSNPAALPSPQAAKPTPSNPNADKAPPAQAMPAPGANSPAAQAQQQPATSP